MTSRLTFPFPLWDLQIALILFLEPSNLRNAFKFDRPTGNHQTKNCCIVQSVWDREDCSWPGPSRANSEDGVVLLKKFPTSENTSSLENRPRLVRILLEKLFPLRSRW
ncbi:hypothetical protein NE237_001051 [Protea cynaroides]|uniref:Uncharacterized protein n=1 Tax=Protea cynaroides TaxID=273540 RepID=A0A9Q0QY27_9MAGN|nr:hypothetical protein NE237_001051 [Protea cynaroides]